MLLEGRVYICISRSLGHPPALLRCNIRSGGNPLGRIDQKKDEDFPVTRFGWILQVEWLNLMLIQVRERDASVSLGDNVSDILE